jgi:hypothetical protein
MSQKLYSMLVFAALLALPMKPLFAQEEAPKQRASMSKPVSAQDSSFAAPSPADRDSSHGRVQTFAVASVNNSNNKGAALKNNSSVAEGMFIGFLTGAMTGVMIGLALGDDQPCPSSNGGSPLAWDFDICVSLSAGEKAAIGGVLLGVTGLLVGRAAASKANGKNDPFSNQNFSGPQALNAARQ